ncbi:MAG: hypothetical protein V1918_02035 [Planctomycetota bacterium]
MNIDIPDKDFEVVFPEGATVKDNIQGKTCVMGAPDANATPSSTAEKTGTELF